MDVIFVEGEEFDILEGAATRIISRDIFRGMSGGLAGGRQGEADRR